MWLLSINIFSQSLEIILFEYVLLLVRCFCIIMWQSRQNITTHHIQQVDGVAPLRAARVRGLEHGLVPADPLLSLLQHAPPVPCPYLLVSLGTTACSLGTRK